MIAIADNAPTAMEVYLAMVKIILRNHLFLKRNKMNGESGRTLNSCIGFARMLQETLESTRPYLNIPKTGAEG